MGPKVDKYCSISTSSDDWSKFPTIIVLSWWLGGLYAHAQPGMVGAESLRAGFA